MLNILLVYGGIVNLIGFMLMSYDKSQAKKSRQRVPERTLFICAAIGGGLGSWLGMRKYRHKTKHMSFVIGIPLLFAVNIFCFYFIYSSLV